MSRPCAVKFTVRRGFCRSTCVIWLRALRSPLPKSFAFSAPASPVLARLVPLSLAGATMIELEVHPEIHVQAQRQHPQYSTCRDCHRTFRAKSEDQLSLELCDACFRALRFPEDAIPTVRVKVLPRR